MREYIILSPICKDGLGPQVQKWAVGVFSTWTQPNHTSVQSSTPTGYWKPWNYPFTFPTVYTIPKMQWWELNNYLFEKPITTYLVDKQVLTHQFPTLFSISSSNDELGVKYLNLYRMPLNFVRLDNSSVHCSKHFQIPKIVTVFLYVKIRVRQL